MSTARKTPHKLHKHRVKLFEYWVADVANLERFFELMEVGLEGQAPLRFTDACQRMEQPYTLLWAFVNRTPELRGRYEALLEARADALAEEALEIADNADPESKADVMKAKLQTEVRFHVASKWLKERYGQHITVDKNVNVSVDEGLLGQAGDLLKVAAKRAPRLIEGEKLPVKQEVE